MNSEVNPPIHCRICGEPISLTFGTVADEDGKPVHERCYVSRMLSFDEQQADTN
jgi:hypothetical protein